MPPAQAVNGGRRSVRTGPGNGGAVAASHPFMRRPLAALLGLSCLVPPVLAARVAWADPPADGGAPSDDAAAVDSQPASPPPARMVVAISGLRNDNGRLYCTAFNSAEGYPSQPERAVGRAMGEPHGRQGRLVFEGLAPGSYALICFHDENGNGRLDTGIFGIPTESYAASNGARNPFGPPRFRDARFEYAGAEQSVPIRM